MIKNLLHLALLLSLGLGVAVYLGCDGEADDDDSVDDDDVVDDDDTGDDDSEGWPESFEGTLTIASSLDGETLCDATIQLTGTRYTGTCDGCDFAFAIDATVTEDNGTDDCYLDPRYTFVESGGFTDMLLMHAPTFAVQGWYGMYYYYDVLASGYSYDYYGYVYPGPYWFIISSTDSTWGSFTQNGNDITFGIDYQGNQYESLYYYDCGGAAYSYGATEYAGAFTGQSELDCSGYYVDVWEFQGDPFGSVFSVVVDTVAENTAFDPWMWINDPSQCTSDWADDTFDCTFPPPSYTCPAIDLTVSEGTYQVVVHSYGSCAGTTGEYELRVDAPADPSLVQVADDVYAYDVTVWDLQVNATGTITP